MDELKLQQKRQLKKTIEALIIAEKQFEKLSAAIRNFAKEIEQYRKVLQEMQKGQ